MYVIFPADELISLTYGIAVPRVQPRPTLDNLRELAPIGNRPVSTTNLSFQQINEPRRNKVQPPRPRTPPILSPRDRSPSVNFSPDDRIYDYDDRTPLYDTDTTVNYVNRDRLLPPSPSPLSNPSPTTVSRSPNPSSGVKAKEKSKSRLHLKLGRLRPHSSNEQSDSARIREDLQIHVSNPVFTRENLRQRNFDAFFESGETVYSLEKKEKPPVIDPIEGDLSNASGYPAGGTQSRSISVNFFRKAKSPTTKSAELEYEEYQKGDRVIENSS